MTILYQSRIYRSDLHLNPSVLYLFGDNLERTGLGGQAGECRGEPNAVGIATKISPRNSQFSFFNDGDFALYQLKMIQDLHRAVKHLVFGYLPVVVLPTDGWGTGLSELPERAPKLNEWLGNVHRQLPHLAHSITNTVFKAENLNPVEVFETMYKSAMIDLPGKLAGFADHDED